MSKRILMIEDEPDLVQPLIYSLKKQGYQVSFSLTGRGGLELARAQPPPDLILLDLMLPDISGTEVCRLLRAEAQTKRIPIIMVTAKSEEIDRVVGFEVGTDDYLVKPFSVRELGLRIKAVLRRGRRKDSAGPLRAHGPIELDEGARRVWLQSEADRRELILTQIEFNLLRYFLDNKGQVQSRETLLDSVWGYREGVSSRTVDTHVKRLRNKLGPAGALIETLRGVGYRFNRELT